MCSAVRRRMLVNGTTSSRAAGPTASAAGRCRRAIGRADGTPRAGAAAGRRSAMLGTRAGAPTSSATGPAPPAGDHRLDVAPGDPTTEAGAADRARVDVVLVQEPAHHRREHEALAGPVRLRGDGAGGGPDRPPAGGRRAPGRDRSRRRRRGRPVPGRCGPTVPALAVPVQAPTAAAGRRPGGLGPTSADAVGAEPLARGAVADTARVDPHVDGVALLHQDLGQDALGRRRHLGVDLVGGHLEERLVPGHLVADRLEPLGDGALGHRLAQLRHGHVRQRGAPFRSGPAPSRRTSRTGTGAAG